jgi:hypothetical protein
MGPKADSLACKVEARANAALVRAACAALHPDRMVAIEGARYFSMRF